MTNNIDPRGEYTRVCPYCRESFVADHLSRFYCPDKNGRKNFCKNRQKRINDKLRKSGSVLVAHENNPIKVFIEEPQIKERNVDQLIINAQKSKNCSILTEFLGGKEYTEVSKNELLEKGFDYKLFDSFNETSSGIKIYFISKYAYHKSPKNNNEYITLKHYYHGTN